MMATAKKNHFLPELSQRRQSGMNIGLMENTPSAKRLEIELRVKEPNADLIDKGVGGQEEIDSICSPEYLRLQYNQSEMRGVDNDDNASPAGDNSGKNRQERRQVIKILDQSKWR